MLHIIFPGQRPSHKLAFYLAAEQWCAKKFPSHEVFFTWIVENSVICGRNQNIPLEVNLDYCRQNNIAVFRRRSGGGAVFADTGNMMISYIAPMNGKTVESIFAAYTTRVASALIEMGLDAVPSGRNDILINGRKVSGGAFYMTANSAIAHSTMLYDTTRQHLLAALTPAKAKLQSKGVTSTPQRITTLLAEGINLSMPQFQIQFNKSLETRCYTLTPDDIAEIAVIEQTYYSPQWLRLDSQTAPSESITRHFPGLGTLSLNISTNSHGLIETASLNSDLMDPPSPHLIQELLQGVDLNLPQQSVASKKSSLPPALVNALIELLAQIKTPQ